jgi:hypothetical protein
MAEIWKVVEDFPSYEVSSLARVRKIDTQRIRKTPIGKRGYPVCSLVKDGKVHLATLHRLVAKAFIPNPYNLPQINHIDGNKANCSISNLEWCTPRHNMLHARETGLHKSDGDKPVLQYTLDGSLVAEYKSASEAARVNGISRSTICNVCCHRKNDNGYEYKTYKGFIWKWKNQTM